MICHEFKGGTGTASRLVGSAGQAWTSALSSRPTMELAPCSGSMAFRSAARGPGRRPLARAAATDAGSIIVVLATDAPLLPIQCQRLARRATTGLAWVGGIGANGSGDIFLGFATGNHLHHDEDVSTVRMLSPDAMTILFQAAAEATEEAILDALTAAETTADCMAAWHTPCTRPTGRGRATLPAALKPTSTDHAKANPSQCIRYELRCPPVTRLVDASARPRRQLQHARLLDRPGAYARTRQVRRHLSCRRAGYLRRVSRLA